MLFKNFFLVSYYLRCFDTSINNSFIFIGDCRCVSSDDIQYVRGYGGSLSENFQWGSCCSLSDGLCGCFCRGLWSGSPLLCYPVVSLVRSYGIILSLISVLPSCLVLLRPCLAHLVSWAVGRQYTAVNCPNIVLISKTLQECEKTGLLVMTSEGWLSYGNRVFSVVFFHIMPFYSVMAIISEYLHT